MDGDGQQLPQQVPQQPHRKGALKLILLGDSAVGKSKLVERFLMQEYKPVQMSTYALTLFEYDTVRNGVEVKVDIWDTAGQERFNSMHPSYYIEAQCCILVFDATRKQTYKNLDKWYAELRQYRESIPCLLACNKIDIAPEDITSKSFAFAEKNNLPLFYVSAATGVNVVAMFERAIDEAVQHRTVGGPDFIQDVLDIMRELDDKPKAEGGTDPAAASTTSSS
eukprot:PhM_4_TR5559/c1_g10_i1/m.2836/K07931/RABL2; Rab-like protein 2